MTTTSSQPQRDGFDLVLRLLDHQIVGSEGELLGNVDNLEVREVDGDLLVTGLVVGPAGLGPRLPGKLGRWTVAIWRRLHPASEPTATVLSMTHVLRIGSGIEVSEWGSRALAGTFGFELWLRRYVIARIPGATDDPDGGGEPVFDDAVVDRRDTAPAEGSHLVSDLLDREVLGSDGAPVGRVTGLRCESVDRTGLDVVGRLRITGVAYGKRPAGSMLGYRADPDQGPRLVAAVIRVWHRDDRHVPIDAVDAIDWSSGAISLRSHAHPRHPHADG